MAYGLSEAQEREIKSLLAFARRTDGVKRLMIVTYEEERIIEKGGFSIEVVPAYKFLLNKYLPAPR